LSTAVGNRDNIEIAGMMHISDHEFGLFRRLIYQGFGIDLNEAKRSLLVRRLQSVVRARGFDSFTAYYHYLTTHPSDRDFTDLVNRITTNYTFFNREPEHFSFFVRVTVPWIRQSHIARGSRDVRIWCAAASTGEEPYMLAMLLLEGFSRDYALWDAGLLATDISEKALAKAVSGRYPADAFTRLPEALRAKWFTRVDAETYEAVPKLKREITFRRFNLINQTYPFKLPFDAIFCRNVMIYFDHPTRERVLARLHACLVPGGYLFIGHSESIIQREGRWQYIQPAVYRKIG